MVSKFLTICIAIILTLFSMISAQTYSWKYSALSGSCSNSMCGLAYQTRTAQCNDETDAVVDQSLCEHSRGPAVNLMECFYSPPEDAKVCGANYGSLAFDCIYNPNHDSTDTSSPYQICQCKNDFTGDFCEVVPPNPPSPDPTPPEPEPEEEDEPKDDKWKLWQYILVFILCVALISAFIGVFILLRKRKAQSTQVTPTPMENFPPSQNGYYEELDNAQA